MVKYYNLPEKFILELESLPETGMGYHIVNVNFLDGKTLDNIVILNSEIMKVENEINIDIDKILKIELVK